MSGQIQKLGNWLIKGFEAVQDDFGSIYTIPSLHNHGVWVSQTLHGIPNSDAVSSESIPQQYLSGFAREKTELSSRIILCWTFFCCSGPNSTPRSGKDSEGFSFWNTPVNSPRVEKCGCRLDITCLQADKRWGGVRWWLKPTAQEEGRPTQWYIEFCFCQCYEEKGEVFWVKENAFLGIPGLLLVLKINHNKQEKAKDPEEELNVLT